MPFIDEKRRELLQAGGLGRLQGTIRDLMVSEDDDFDAGDLAYVVYSLLQTAAKGLRFERRNAMMGAVDEARLTWRRLQHDPAEDKARGENGDV